jgi:hypothetical protein
MEKQQRADSVSASTTPATRHMPTAIIKENGKGTRDQCSLGTFLRKTVEEFAVLQA